MVNGSESDDGHSAVGALCMRGEPCSGRSHNERIGVRRVDVRRRREVREAGSRQGVGAAQESYDKKADYEIMQLRDTNTKVLLA